jgi:hypothetical protein
VKYCGGCCLGSEGEGSGAAVGLELGDILPEDVEL